MISSAWECASKRSLDDNARKKMSNLGAICHVLYDNIPHLPECHTVWHAISADIVDDSGGLFALFRHPNPAAGCGRRVAGLKSGNVAHAKAVRVFGAKCNEVVSGETLIISQCVQGQEEATNQNCQNGAHHTLSSLQNNFGSTLARSIVAVNRLIAPWLREEKS